jgi:hypothetical protein
MMFKCMHAAFALLLAYLLLHAGLKRSRHQTQSG